MNNLKIRAGEWVVVCDGAKALVLENAGDDVFPNLKTREVHTHANAPTREHGTVAAPRARQTDAGGGKTATAAGADDGERSFLVDVAGRLDAALGAGEVKSMVVVAPPKALGILRGAYSPALASAVRAELDKDLVNVPVDQIERRLTA